MRDEVFRLPAPVGSRPRTLDLDGEPWWVLGDVLVLRGYARQLARLPELLGRLTEDEAERVWVLQPGEERPRALWVVSAEGRAAVHDMHPQRQGRRRRTGPRGSTSRRPPG